jgi:hypothetical protein
MKVMVGITSQLSDALAEPVLAGIVEAVHSIVTLTGHVITGGVLSSTVITCTQVLKLPQSSVAFQVLLIVYSCGQVCEAVVTSIYVIVGITSQLSDALADPVFAGSVEAVHSIVTLIGQVITGGVLSSTVITCTQVLKLPQSSVAFQVLEIEYSCGQVCEAVVTSIYVIVGITSQLSDALADPVFAGSVDAVHSMVTLSGHVITGGVLSSTVITCTQVLELPQSSVAFQVRLIVYSCGQVGEAVVTSIKVMVGIISQLSDAVADPVLAGRVDAVHSIVTLIGHVITGGVLSSTVITCTQVLKLPQSSVAFQVRLIVYSCGHVCDAVVISV